MDLISGLAKCCECQDYEHHHPALGTSPGQLELLRAVLLQGHVLAPGCTHFVSNLSRVRHTHRFRRCAAFAGCFRIATAPSALKRGVRDGLWLASVCRHLST